MSDVYPDEMVDDVRPEMFSHARRGRPFALATIVAADGGPRPVGAQILIDERSRWGYLSGDCIDADVVAQGREVLEHGTSRTLIYGRGSPFIDLRLPCGGRLEVLIEAVGPEESALARLEQLTAARAAMRWLSNGSERHCLGAEQHLPGNWPVDRLFEPDWRLAVVGTSPFALATAQLGRTMAFDTVLVAPQAPPQFSPFGLNVDRRKLGAAFAALAADPWTAIVIAMHDAEIGEAALVAALETRAGYVGVIGSRRRIPERLERLRANGLSAGAAGRVHMPAGLPIKARSAWDVGAAIMAEIVAKRCAASATGG